MNISPNNEEIHNPSTRSEGNLTTPSPGKSDSIASIKSGKSTRRRSTVSSKGPSARTKGLNFNVAISPAVSTTSPPMETSGRIQSSHSDSHANYLNQSSSDDLKYDLQIPSSEKLYNLDIEEQLRLLALKEMSIVETKDSISDLTNRLRRFERELHQLREVIQRSLYKEISASGRDSFASNSTSSNNPPQRRNSANPREEAIANTKNGSRRRNISVSSIGRRSFEAENEASQNNDNRKSKIWTNLSKPLTLIQQFDNMLQNEFERSLIPNHPTSEEMDNREHFPRSSQDSNSTSSSMSSPLKFKVDHSKSSITNLDELNYDTTHDSVTPKAERADDDMFQAVSTSLWSFVNDVKQNVLASLGEENHSINSTTDLGENQTASQPGIEQGDSSGLSSSMSEMQILTDEQRNHIKDTDFEANNSDYDSNNDAENTVRLEGEKQTISNVRRKSLN
ncbi:Piso0_000409 [Millerozyma farinosa CBS 7064]|uniref:Piso0_000409 protein n=1 Tax=Pichia sorbitophila (strain ATCC MYA-4447 / BCRC 22081 / CBS 7064 / NBRC 10061 / NRRL Y-12695) TaxID=559304 RepID=G8YTX5_PICSO|nr:Piso0_000409 [Millerozyma farinosa CBS 7064]CCE73376.1 Piso0_000409 [Millerozyma farinosa CBS 7064]